MDGLDFRILAALHRDGTLSQAAVGREVGLTGPAVANRLARLRERGTLLGFRAALDAGVFGRTSTMHVLPGPFDQPDVDRVLAAPNVVWVAWKLDGGMTVMSYGPTDLTSWGTVADTMAGDEGPKPAGRLARRVLAAVVRSPRAGRDHLAAMTGLTPKTCAKHRHAAIEAGHLSILPRLGMLQGEGALVYHVAVFGDATADEVGAALGQATLVNQTPGVQYWFCMAPDLATSMQRQAAVQALGVEARITMNRSLVQNDDRLVRWLAQDRPGSGVS